MDKQIYTKEGKILIIGHYRPGITKFDKTYAVTGDKWHEIPDGTDLDDLEFVEAFDIYQCKWTPRNFDEWLLHKEMLKSSKLYNAYWTLFCKQQYVQQYPLALLNPDFVLLMKIDVNLGFQ